MLLSSHILAEVEALCDRVSIIRAGRTVETGTLADLRHLTRTSVDAVLADAPPDELLGPSPACTTSPPTGPECLPVDTARGRRGRWAAWASTASRA